MRLPSLLLLPLLLWSAEATVDTIRNAMPYWKPCPVNQMFNPMPPNYGCTQCGAGDIYTRIQGVFGLCLNQIAYPVNYGVIINMIKALRGESWWHDERPPVYCRDRTQCKICPGGYVVSVNDNCPVVQTININVQKCQQPNLYQYIPADNRCELNPDCPRDRAGNCWAVGYNNYMECAQFERREDAFRLYCGRLN